MNKTQRNNRPKRVRIASSKTGVAQPRTTNKTYPGTAIMIPDSVYNSMEAMAKDKTPKVQRKGNYYETTSRIGNNSNKVYYSIKPKV